jgi:hypothetical protein
MFITQTKTTSDIAGLLQGTTDDLEYFRRVSGRFLLRELNERNRESIDALNHHLASGRAPGRPVWLVALGELVASCTPPADGPKAFFEVGKLKDTMHISSVCRLIDSILHKKRLPRAHELVGTLLRRFYAVDAFAVAHGSTIHLAASRQLTGILNIVDTPGPPTDIIRPSIFHRERIKAVVAQYFTVGTEEPQLSTSTDIKVMIEADAPTHTMLKRASMLLCQGNVSVKNVNGGALSGIVSTAIRDKKKGISTTVTKIADAIAGEAGVLEDELRSAMTLEAKLLVLIRHIVAVHSEGFVRAVAAHLVGLESVPEYTKTPGARVKGTMLNALRRAALNRRTRLAQIQGYGNLTALDRLFLEADESAVDALIAQKDDLMSAINIAETSYTTPETRAYLRRLRTIHDRLAGENTVRDEDYDAFDTKCRTWRSCAKWLATSLQDPDLDPIYEEVAQALVPDGPPSLKQYIVMADALSGLNSASAELLQRVQSALERYITVLGDTNGSLVELSKTDQYRILLYCLINNCHRSKFADGLPDVAIVNGNPIAFLHTAIVVRTEEYVREHPNLYLTQERAWCLNFEGVLEGTTRPKFSLLKGQMQPSETHSAIERQFVELLRDVHRYTLSEDTDEFRPLETLTLEQKIERYCVLGASRAGQDHAQDTETESESDTDSDSDADGRDDSIDVVKLYASAVLDSLSTESKTALVEFAMNDNDSDDKTASNLDLIVGSLRKLNTYERSDITMRYILLLYHEHHKTPTGLADIYSKEKRFCDLSTSLCTIPAISDDEHGAMTHLMIAQIAAMRSMDRPLQQTVVNREAEQVFIDVRKNGADLSTFKLADRHIFAGFGDNVRVAVSGGDALSEAITNSSEGFNAGDELAKLAEVRTKHIRELPSDAMVYIAAPDENSVPEGAYRAPRPHDKAVSVDDWFLGYVTKTEMARVKTGEPQRLVCNVLVPVRDGKSMRVRAQRFKAHHVFCPAWFNE